MTDSPASGPALAIDDPITVAEVEAIARKRLPGHVYDFYACGADDQDALRSNQNAFSDIKIVPRVLKDVRNIDTSTEIFGWKTTMPVAFAPSAMQRLAGGEGETDTAKAAVSAGLGLTLSSQSTTSLEDVMAAAKQEAGGVVSPKLWFQIYLTPDWERNTELIKRAEDAGYEALVLTVDTPVLGNRINERKTPLVLPSHLKLANYSNPSYGSGGNKLKPSFNRQLMDARSASQYKAILETAKTTIHDPSLEWDVISKLKGVTKMKVILKGIMAAEDAKLAIDHGADAIVVSNHGGRQLDCTPSTLEQLPAIAEVVKGKIPVIFDGGVRRGSDVFKAIALGADLVLIGRPVLWGLGYKGREGVETVANILERELSRTMALAGITTIADIPKASLVFPHKSRL